MKISTFLIAVLSLGWLLAVSQEQNPDSTANKIILEPYHRNTNHQGINLTFDYRYYPGIRNNWKRLMMN